MPPRPVVFLRTLPLALALLGAAGPPALAAQAASPKAAEIKAGRLLFENHCAPCHGIDGRGGRGPGLNRVLLPHAPTDAAMTNVIANGLDPGMPPAWFLTDDEVASVIAYVRSLSKVPSEPLPGNAERGAAVYQRGGCSACHILAGAGTGFGPELTDVTVQRSPARIKATVAAPAANLPDGFLMVEAVTSKGQKLSGLRANEDSFTIQLKTQDGRFVSLNKADLAALRKLRGQTPMPAYGATFSPSDLDDLVAYLASQRQASRGKE